MYNANELEVASVDDNAIPVRAALILTARNHSKGSTFPPMRDNRQAALPEQSRGHNSAAEINTLTGHTQKKNGTGEIKNARINTGG